MGMVDRHNSFIVLTKFFGFGDGDSAESESSLCSRIAELQKQLMKLSQQLHEMRIGGKVYNCTALMDTIQKQMPFLQMEHISRTTETTSREAVIVARNASYFYTEKDNEIELYSDAPVHTDCLDISPSMILRYHKAAGFLSGTMHIMGLKTLDLRDFAGSSVAATGEEDDDESERDGDITVTSQFSHPHARGAFTGDTDALCFGNNNAREILANVRKVSDVMLFLRAAYDWLTHVTIDDAYHQNVSYILCGQRMREVIGAAYVALAEELGHFLIDERYERMVEEIRAGQLTNATLYDFDEILLGEVKEQFQLMKKDKNIAKLIEGHLYFLTAEKESQAFPGIPHFLAFHQMMSAAALWKKFGTGMNQMLQNATLSDMFLRPYAWHDEAYQWKRLIQTECLEPNPDFRKQVKFKSLDGVKRYLNNYEYIKGIL